MKQKHYECESCESVFRISYDMDPEKYPVTHCPFCGTELELDPDNGWDVDSDD